MARIDIVEPSRGWPLEYASIEQRLRAALGGLALRIDHIGSTAVPDLPAKDVIDIQVTVKDLADPGIVAKLSGAGFVHKPDIDSDNLVGVEAGSRDLKKLYFQDKPDTRPAHIHVREDGRQNQQYPLLFRDFLIADNMVRSAYALVKQELAARFPDDATAYYAIKDPYMDTIYRAACLWGREVGWSGASSN